MRLYNKTFRCGTCCTFTRAPNSDCPACWARWASQIEDGWIATIDRRYESSGSGERRVKLKIISGGQTGVDRGALNAALEAGIPHGGFCPLGRRAEDGVIPEHFLLSEAATAAYPARTAMNVRQGDATLLLVHGSAGLRCSRGTRLTLEMCRRQDKAWHAADPRRPDHAKRVASWLEEISSTLEGPPGWLEGLERQAIFTLNVAGPRESKVPGIHDETVDFLRMVLGRLRENSSHFQLS